MALAIAIGLLGVLIAAWFVPIEIRAHGAVADDDPSGSLVSGFFEVRWWWLMGYRVGTDGLGRLRLVGVPVHVGPAFGGGAGKAEGGRGREKKKKKPRRRRARRRGGWRAVGPTALRMLRRALRLVHPRVEVRGTLGLGDPADTAWAWTVAHRLGAVLPPWIEIRLEDDLLEVDTHLDGRVEGRVVPAEVLAVAVGWLVRSETRRVLWQVAPG